MTTTSPNTVNEYARPSADSDISEIRRAPIPLEDLNHPAVSTGYERRTVALAAIAGKALSFRYASSFYWSGAGSAGRAVGVEVIVRKTGSIQSVQLHYDTHSGGWADLDLPLVHDSDDYAVYRLSDNTFPVISGFEFVVKCTVDGTTHWDNNGSSNYFLPGSDARILPGNVCLDYADVISYPCPSWMGCYHSTLSGRLFVRDLSYVKDVGIRYTWDGWANWADAAATWVENIGYTGVQSWHFTASRYTPAAAGVPEFEFAAFYRDGASGLWFWDNSLGYDYRLSDSGAAHLE